MNVRFLHVEFPPLFLTERDGFILRVELDVSTLHVISTAMDCDQVSYNLD